MKKRIKEIAYLSMVSMVFITACQTLSKPEESVSLSQSGDAKATPLNDPTSDLQYSTILSRWTRDVSLYQYFLMNMQATATLMTPDMVQAYTMRQRRLTKVDNLPKDPILIPDQDHVSIVVSEFVTNANLLDLENARLWTISLVIGSQSFVPVEVKRYRRPEALSPYFPLCSQYGRFYIIRFEKTSSAIQAFQKQGENQKYALTLTSNAGSATFVWPAT